MSEERIDINRSIPMGPEIVEGRPRFATTGRNLFITYTENDMVFLKCSNNGGANISAPIPIMSNVGNIDFLRINARDDTAVVAATVQDPNGILWVRGVAGKIFQDPNAELPEPQFIFNECPERQLPEGITFDDILDLSIRVNEDGSSEDFVFMRSGTGSSVVATGHHPSFLGA